MALALVGGATAQEQEAQEGQRPRFGYGAKGLELETTDGNTSLWFGVRLQTRYTSVGDDPAVAEDPVFESDLELRRGRFKLGGHVFRPWLQVYSEHDFPSEALLDLRVTAGAEDGPHLRTGQWKSDYNRERIDSSGKQQLVERSISTYWFTIDRQQGASLSGRFGEGQAHDSSYWLELLSGQGRGGGWENGEWMLMGRYQWNFIGRLLAFSQSDLERRTEAAGSLSLAAVFSQTGFTRFSGDGGGQLPGYTDGRYELWQLQQGSAYQYRGFSFQQELHFKSIRDRDDGETQDLLGGYASVGTFPGVYWPGFSEKLELAVRGALVDPDLAQSGLEQEWTVGANWFFNGHRNKLTADLGYVTQVDPGTDDEAVRLRLQWDVSF